MKTLLLVFLFSFVSLFSLETPMVGTGLTPYQNFIKDVGVFTSTKNAREMNDFFLKEKNKELKKFVDSMSYYFYYSNASTAMQKLNEIDVKSLNLTMDMKVWMLEALFVSKKYSQIINSIDEYECVKQTRKNKNRCYFYVGMSKYKIDGKIPKEFDYIANSYSSIYKIIEGKKNEK